MNKLEQGVQNEQVGPQGPAGVGLTGEASAIAKLAGTEETAAIATKVNEVIDALIERGVFAASE